MDQQLVVRNKAVPIVELKAVTWSKDSHGLFDYENNQYEMKKFQISSEAKIYRINNDIIPTTKPEIPVNDNYQTEFLLQIGQDPINKDRFFIKTDAANDNSLARIQNPNLGICLIVRSQKAHDGKNQRGYAVNPGDTIKLGRIEYRVIESQVGVNNLSVKKVAEAFDDESYFDVNAQVIPESQRLECRYCLSTDICDDKDSIDNKQLFPCKCIGSTGGVHFQCLKTWIKHKIVSKSNNNTATYQWKKLECEVCKQPLQRQIKYNDEFHELITVEKPTCPYIMLERISPSDQKSSTLSLIVPTDHEPIRLGRGHQCDLRISDISVSRVHALMKYKDGRFLLFDNESKFGTLIVLKNNYQIQSDKAAIQIGRTVFTFVQKYIKNTPQMILETRPNP